MEWGSPNFMALYDPEKGEVCHVCYVHVKMVSIISILCGQTHWLLRDHGCAEWEIHHSYFATSPPRETQSSGTSYEPHLVLQLMNLV